MKRSWGWILVWIIVVCLLRSLAVETSMKPASRLAKHSVAWSRESRSPSSCQSLRVLSGSLIRGRTGTQQFFTPDVLSRAEDLDPVGPPWWELRGPPGRYRDLVRPVGLPVAKVTTTALIKGGELRPRPEFSGGRPPET